MALRLGIAQIHTRPGDLTGTLARISAQAEAAAARGVDLLVFPLTTLLGPAPVTPTFQRRFVADASRAVEGIAHDLACPCLVPLPIEVNGVPSCDAILIADGSATLVREYGSTISPTAPVLVSFGGVSVCIVFSYDEMEELVVGLVPADVVICLSDLEYSIDDPACGLAVSDASPLGHPGAPGVWTAVVGAVGGYGASVYLGASYIAAPDGDMVVAAPAFDEALVVADVGDGADLTAHADRTPYDAHYYLWQALTMGIRDYVTAVRVHDVVLALDGSLASEVLAVAATDALGPTHVHALLCGHGSREPEIRRLADKVHLTLHESLTGSLPSDRLGMGRVSLALAEMANEHDALTLLSVDKTALAFGAGIMVTPSFGLAPLADVFRSDLLIAAHVRNAISPVFPSLTPNSVDVPDLDISTSMSKEALLGQVDDAIAAYVTGDAVLAKQVDDDVAVAVLAALRTQASCPLTFVPLLAMSSVTLYESHLPVGFGWQPSSLAEDIASPWATVSSQVPTTVSEAGSEPRAKRADAPPDAQTVAGALRETLDLLQDLSVGEVGAWPSPFSEN